MLIRAVTAWLQCSADCGVSTLLFNGHLAAFDGYYVLATGIEIPNLSGRHTIFNYLNTTNISTGMREAIGDLVWSERVMVLSSMDRRFIYRMFIIVAIMPLLRPLFSSSGFCCAIWAARRSFCCLGKGLSFCQGSPKLRTNRPRR